MQVVGIKRLGYYWSAKNGVPKSIPYLFVYCDTRDDALRIKADFEKYFGCQIGNLHRSNAQLIYVGASALEFKNRCALDRGNSGAYQYACRFNLIDKLAALLGWPEHAGHVWTKELCEEQAKKYRWPSEWVVGHIASYVGARSGGWLAEINKKYFPAHKKPVEIYWTKERCFEAAKRYKTRSDWEYGADMGSYGSAKRHKWLKEIGDAAFGPPVKVWDVRRANAAKHCYPMLIGLYRPNAALWAASIE